MAREKEPEPPSGDNSSPRFLVRHPRSTHPNNIGDYVGVPMAKTNPSNDRPIPITPLTPEESIAREHLEATDPYVRSLKEHIKDSPEGPGKRALQEELRNAETAILLHGDPRAAVQSPITGPARTAPGAERWQRPKPKRSDMFT